MIVPPAAIAAPITISMDLNPPSGVPALTAKRGSGPAHVTSTTRMPASARRVMDSSGLTPLLYITLSATGSVTFTGYPGFTINLPAADQSSGPFYLAQFDNNNNAWITVAGPQDVNNGSVTFPMDATGSLTIPANGSVYFALYSGGVAPTSSPSVAPSGVATPTPSGSTPTPGSSPTPIPSGTTTATPTAAPTTTLTAAPTPTPGGTGTPIGTPTPVPTPTHTPTPTPSPTITATPPPTSTPISTPSPSPTPTASPSSAPTIAPTATPGTPTPTPTAFPTTTPTATPTPGGGGQTVTSFSFGTLQTGSAGTSSSQLLNFKAFNSSSAQVNGAFANSVTVASSDPSTTLSVNGGTASQSVTLTSGSQQLSLNYSGIAVNPVTLTASATSATTQTASFSPTLSSVAYSGPLVSSNPEVDLYATSGNGSTVTFTASQLGWTGTTYGQTLIATIPSACNGFATVTQPSSTASSTYTITAIGSPTVGSCTMSLGGFQSSINIKITYSTFGVILQ